MKLIGTMAVRNEDYELGFTLRAALLWLDAVVVLLHECIDGSADIVEEVIRENDRGRVHVLRASGEWTEMQHRQAMLEHAREMSATHIAIVDADEVLSGNLQMFMRAMKVADSRDCGILDRQMLQLPLYYMRGSLTRYHNNGIWGNRLTDVAFRDDPLAHWGGDTFHARAPRGVRWRAYEPIPHGQGGIMHLWACTERRIKAKCALYKVTERLRWPDKPMGIIDRMYSWAIHGDPDVPQYGTPATWTYAEAPAEWWAPYKPLMKYLDVDAVPWQEAHVRALIAKHGSERFAGIDLFGVV